MKIIRSPIVDGGCTYYVLNNDNGKHGHLHLLKMESGEWYILEVTINGLRIRSLALSIFPTRKAAKNAALKYFE